MVKIVVCIAIAMIVVLLAVFIDEILFRRKLKKKETEFDRIIFRDDQKRSRKCK